MKAVRVDIDGVIVEEKPTFERSLAMPMYRAKKSLGQLRELGYTIILETARGWAEYDMTVNQLMHYQVPYDILVMAKPIANYVIDDRAIKFNSWPQTILEITRPDDDDIWALHNVRQSTAEFLRSLYLEGHTLEVSPMVKSEMPFPEFYVDPTDYARGTYQYCGNDAKTTDFFQYNSVTPQVDHLVAVNVLEHMERVWEFPKKCKSLSIKNVHIYVPYCLRFHGPRPDLWRFTDTGLKYLMSGFECTRLELYGPPTKPYGIGASFKNV